MTFIRGRNQIVYNWQALPDEMVWTGVKEGWRYLANSTLSSIVQLTNAIVLTERSSFAIISKPVDAP
jgi:hypothetical protein